MNENSYFFEPNLSPSFLSFKQLLLMGIMNKKSCRFEIHQTSTNQSNKW